jgi:N-acetylglucosaminyl-diphospho-decaprenol L-rhamnosyltransferase
MDISIIIVNYKSKGLTLNCVKSIEEADFGNLEHETIVIDNDSGDQLGEILAWQHPGVIFIQSPVNKGMGGGNNIGLRRARGEYVVVMNPDTLAFRDTFIKLYEFMEANPDVGMAGPQQFNPDRSVQNSRYRFPKIFTLLFRRTFLGRLPFAKKAIAHFMMDDVSKKHFHTAEWLLGSCLFIRATALKEVGYFDERFFLYFEDTDLCRRFWKKNWNVIYYPDAHIIHNHNRASADNPWYTFFLNRASRKHLLSWVAYLNKWRWQ